MNTIHTIRPTRLLLTLTLLLALLAPLVAAPRSALAQTLTTDTTAPETTITEQPSNPLGSFTSAVFSFTSSEAGSSFQCSLDGAAFATCTSPQRYSDTELGLGKSNHTFQVRATDAAGNTDSSPATYSWSSIPQPPPWAPYPQVTMSFMPNGQNGWFTTSPAPGSVTAQAYDGLTITAIRCIGATMSNVEGLGTSSVRATVAVTNEGTTRLSCWATDSSGIESELYIVVVRVDTVAPDTTITEQPAHSTTSTTASFSFTSSETNSTFSCSLDGSAFAACTGPQSYSGLADGSHTFQVRATDAAGNTDATPASATWTIQTDTTAPVAQPSQSPAANGAGWTNGDVTVNWNWSDNTGGSGIDPAKCQGSNTSNGEGTLQLTAACTDQAGNTGSASYTVKLDTTTPTLKPIVSPNPVLRGGSATASPNASDATSGVASQGCGAVDTSSVGTKTVQCSATDNAGNSNSASVSYQVVYKWTGFLQPVDNLPTLNVVKAGSAIPVKFSLGGNQGLNIFAANAPASQQIACDSGAPVADIEQTVTAGASSLQYDAASDTYTYVWKTDKAWTNTCRQLSVTLNDGTVHTANFKFK